MATAVTVSGQDILFYMAERLGEMKSAKVTTATSTTSITCSDVAVDADTYKYAIGRILGKGTTVVTAQSAVGVFTLSPALSIAPALGDIFQWCWWTGNKQGDAQVAMLDAIRYAYPFWYREKQTGVPLTGTVAKASSTAVTGTGTLFLSELAVGDYISIPGTAIESKEISAIASNTALTVSSAFANTASGQTGTIGSNITLAAGTNIYVLPSACDALLAIGIQSATTDAVEWLEWGDESAEYWAVEGQRGGYRIRFNPRFSRAGAIPDAYDTQTLQLWYATREPVLTDLTTASCQLPVEYFNVAAASYAIANLPTASRVDLLTANVAIPQLQQRAQTTLQTLGVGKRPPSRLLNPNAGLNTEQFNVVTMDEGDGSTQRKREAKPQGR